MKKILGRYIVAILIILSFLMICAILIPGNELSKWKHPAGDLDARIVYIEHIKGFVIINNSYKLNRCKNPEEKLAILEKISVGDSISFEIKTGKLAIYRDEALVLKCKTF